MPYLAESDTTLPRVAASGTDAQGNEYSETESVVYPAGSIVYEDDIAPETVDRLEGGKDEHLSSLLTHISGDEARKLEAERAEQGPIAPEHEAEAEVLATDG